jgi:hypothetical protein
MRRRNTQPSDPVGVFNVLSVFRITAMEDVSTAVESAQ